MKQQQQKWIEYWNSHDLGMVIRSACLFDSLIKYISYLRCVHYQVWRSESNMKR